MGFRSVVTVDRITEALQSVNDPHMPLSIVKMGMVDSIEIKSGRVEVKLRMPCLSCPGVAVLQDAIRGALLALGGVSEVTIDFGWGRPWSASLVEPEARSIMQAHGLLL